MKEISFVYKNHRGEVETRHVIPESIEFELTPHPEYHAQPGWVLNGFDLDKQARRTFLLANFVVPFELVNGGHGNPVEAYKRLMIKFEG